MGGPSIDWTEIVRRALIAIGGQALKRGGNSNRGRCEMSVLLA